MAPNLGLLFLSLLAWGALMGAMDVAMNAQGVTVESAYGRPVLAGFHAVWSLASFAGAVLGGFGAALHVSIAAQQAVIGVVAAVAVLVLGRAFLPDVAHDEPPTRSRRIAHVPEVRLVLLGLAAVFALMAEGAVADWSGVLLRDHVGVTAGKVGLAYAAFCVTMTAGRLTGDRVVEALGRARCFAALALVGAAGLGAGLVVDTFPATVAGFAALGLGLSIMIPVLYSTAADTTARRDPRSRSCRTGLRRPDRRPEHDRPHRPGGRRPHRTAPAAAVRTRCRRPGSGRDPAQPPPSCRLSYCASR